MIDIGLEFEVGETEDDLEFDAQDYVGLSAYQIAVKHGYEGTEEQWIASISKTKTSQLENDGNGKSPFATEAYVNEHSSTGGTTDYNQLINKPKINGIELSGEVELAVPHSTSELNNDGDGNSPFATKTEVEEAIAAIPAPKVPTKTSELENDGDGTSSFATQQDVADAAKDKLTIVTNTTTATKAYIAKTDGSQGTIDVATGVAANTLAQRGADGRLQVGAATADNDAVNLAYANAHYLPSKEVDKTSSSDFFTSINNWTGKIQYSPATFDEWHSDLKYDYRFGVVTRDFNGVIYTGNFAKGYTTGYEVPNKKYVDAADNKIKDTVSKQAADIELLYTLIENTIITNTTVEDTYTSRVTASGLPVVSNTPTTVHKITGASAASTNLATVKDQTIVSNGVTFIGSATDGTVQMTGSVTEENEYATATVTSGFYLPVGTYTLYGPHKADKVGWHVRNAQGTSIAELNWNGTTTAVSFTVSVAGDYHLYVFIPRSAGALDYTETPMLLRGDRTANLPAFEPYYAGVKHAVFMGIASTGINLVDFSDAPEGKLVKETGSIDTTNNYWFTPVAYFPCAAGQEYRHTTEHRNTMFKTAVAAFYDEAKTFISAQQISGNSPYLSVVAPRGAQYMRWSFSKAGNPAVKPTQPMVYIRRMDTIPAYEPYVGDETFALTNPVTLGKWDTIDVEAGKQIVGTATETQDTPYTEEQLAQFDEYILSADGKTVAYKTSVPTEMALSMPKTYIVWRNGSETVITGKNDALLPTITQSYYEEVASNQ